MSSREPDFNAIARVARRIDLRDLRLTDLKASHSPGDEGSLEHNVKAKSVGHLISAEVIAVTCRYVFTATSAGKKRVQISADYLMLYEVFGDEPIEEDDLKQFADVNGPYHSWPFLRQLLFDITSKMGFPPFNLPIFHARPSREPSPKAATSQSLTDNETKKLTGAEPGPMPSSEP